MTAERANSTVPGPAVDSHRARALVDLQRWLGGCSTMGELMSVLANELRSLLPVSDRVSIVFLEPDGEWLRIYRVLPAAGASAPLPRVRVEGTPVGQVVTSGVGRVVSDVRADPNITFGHASHDRIRSTVSVPIRVGGVTVGALNTGSRIAGACQPEMLDEVADVAAVVGPAVFAAEAIFGRAEERPRASGELSFDEERPEGLVGESREFRAMLATARRVARSNADVLITGETGVGKTALARAIHAWSRRAGQPFVTVHLADLSPGLIESELFGHERGAFTGASASRLGRFESAQGGTLLLDEIGETPPAIQAKLLRVIQERCFERVGGTRTIASDVRIIAATHRDLRGAVASGEFREDLFYRLNVVPVHVPALRERHDDLVALVDSILARVADGDVSLSPDAWRRVRAHSWPGNIRELESVLRRAAILEPGPVLELTGFPESRPRRAGAPDGDGGVPTLDENERRYLVRVLEICQGVIEGPDGAAALVGLRPSTLRSRMKRLGVSAAPMRRKGRR